jgi:aspartyl-tRNA(Asn)/glutamyl-tRNA(Gln) amidotransferase subunit C
MPDALTTAEVERIAALAKLALAPEERVVYAAQLARILEYARQVDDLDTAGVPPTAGVADHPPAERVDAPRTPLDRGEALANAPDAAAGLFRVPKVLGDA